MIASDEAVGNPHGFFIRLAPISQQKETDYGIEKGRFGGS
jgi:hypothetical protein